MSEKGWLVLRPSQRMAVFGCKPHYQTTALCAALVSNQTAHLKRAKKCVLETPTCNNEAMHPKSEQIYIIGCGNAQGNLVQYTTLISF